MSDQILVEREFLECMRSNLYDINRGIHNQNYSDVSFRLGRYWEAVNDLLDDDDEDEDEDDG